MEIDEIIISVLKPTVTPAINLTKEDVWGEYDIVAQKRIREGMIVARSEQLCPYFGDKLPYKSVTVVCTDAQRDEVIYWLEYVHGGGSVAREMRVDKDRVALRSNYLCW